MRKMINAIVAVVMFTVSFCTLFVCVNITSLDRELDDYMRSTPYASTIRVGELGYFSRLMMGVSEGMNKLNNLVYYSAAEITVSSFLPEHDAPPPALTDTEVARIRGLSDIAAVFEFDQMDSIIRWTVKAPVGLGDAVCPMTADYLMALHPPLKEGRYFQKSDPPNVLLIQEDYAKNIITGPDILGKRVTVYTNTGKEQFTVIGVLARIPSSYLGSTSLPASVVIPYRPGTRMASYVRGDGQIIPLPARPQLWIVPQEGHEQRLLATIRKILGNEKYNAVTSSSTWEFENSLGVQVRRERIKTLSTSSALTLLIGIMTIGSLIYFNMSSRQREQGIRMSIGATKVQITREHTAVLLSLLCMIFPIAVITLRLLLPLFTKYNALGEYVSPYRSAADVLPLHIDATAVVAAFGLLAVLVVAVSAVVTLRALRGGPSRLLSPSANMAQRRTQFVLALALVMIVTVGAMFISVSQINTIQRTTQDLLLDVPEKAFWISPVQSTIPYADVGAKYSLDDYRAIREAVVGRALVGCRIVTPMSATIPLPSGGDFSLRISGATEDFPAIYGMTMEAGRFLTDADVARCVIGADVAESMNLKIGDTLMGDDIIGILQAHSSLIDDTVYVPLADSYTILSPQELSVRLLVKPLDRQNSDEVTETILSLLESRHPGYSRGSAIDVRDTIDAIIRSREGVYGLLSVFTLCSFLSALLYLTAMFLIEGIQKTREIGIKRAVGAERRMIQREFLWKGLRIGLTALGIGVGGGALASFVLAKSEGMTFSLQPGLLLGFVVSCCACLLLASYIPARYASSITPVEALHRE
ncbi:ABC transporter permease [bacterium]|nr:ABC transporter permease [bacterium]